jgi:hypothetical protein
MQTKKLLPILLVPALLVFATTAGGVQRAWAVTLLDDDSREWRMDSSGDVSPDGVWLLNHPGHGYSEVDNGVLKLRPKIDDNNRHSTLITANKIEYKGIHGEVEVKLEKQGDGPEKWDSFWAMLAYVGQTTHIAFVLKTDDGGWKVTKRDHDHEGQDLHVAIAQGHQIDEADFGHWYHIEWWVVPNGDDLHIKVKVDGNTLVDTDDDTKWDRNGNEGSGTSSYFLKADKTVGAYCEKSYTSWRNFEVHEVKDWG